MNKRRLLIGLAMITLAACSKHGNPLLNASDGQFLRWIERTNPIAPSCAAALYEQDLFVRQYNGIKFVASSKISSVSEPQKNACISELLKRASEIGIDGNITREQVMDDRVRQRYLSARKG